MLKIPFLENEWLNVRSALFSEDADRQMDAVEILTSWRVKSGSEVPMAAEATELVLRARLADQLRPADDWWNQENLRLLHSIAIIRFINFVNETAQKGERLRPMQQAVEQMNIPAWLVRLRHDAAHQHLPGLPQLRAASDFALTWLKDKYWRESLADVVAILDEDGGVGSAVNRIHNCLVRFERLRNRMMFGTAAARKETQQRLDSSLHHFRKLLRNNKQLLLNVFATEGHLILNEQQLINSNWFLKETTLPVIVQEFWRPLLTVVQEIGAVPDLLYVLVARLSGPSLRPQTKLQLQGWTGLIIDAYSERNQPSQTNGDTFDWHKILRAMLSAPEHYTSAQFHSVTNAARPKLSSEQIEILSRLTDLFCGRVVDADCGLGEGWKLFESGMVEASRGGARELDAEIWQKDQWGGWADLPLGLAPGDSAESLDLTLCPSSSRKRKSSIDSSLAVSSKLANAVRNSTARN